jgi:hypothetical protein
MGLMSLTPVWKEWVLFASERGVDLLTQFRGFGHQGIDSPKNGTEGRIRRVIDRHGICNCNRYSKNTA